MRARYYEPTAGRFVSEDPSQDGTNWYSYCLGNPIYYVDANGRDAETEAAAQAAKYKLFAGFIGFIVKGIGEFSKDFQDGGYSIKRITLKTAAGIIGGYVTSWAITFTIETLAIGFGAIKACGLAAIAVLGMCAYSVLLIWVLDAIAMGGMDHIIDQIAPDPDGGGFHW